MLEAHTHLNFTHISFENHIVEWLPPDPNTNTVFVLMLGKKKPITRITKESVDTASELSPQLDDVFHAASWRSQFVPFRRLHREAKRDQGIEGVFGSLLEIADVLG